VLPESEGMGKGISTLFPLRLLAKKKKKKKKKKP